MAHLEIVAALAAFGGLFLAWFVVPSSVPVAIETSTAREMTPDVVPTAA